MPLLYGEGSNALLRLQEEILRTIDDYSLLAQLACHCLGSQDISELELNESFFHKSTASIMGPLTTDLAGFRVPKNSSWRYSDLEIDMEPDIQRLRGKFSQDERLSITPALTPKGLQITLPIFKVLHNEYLAYLYCKHRATGALLYIALKRLSPRTPRFEIRSFKLRQHHFLPAKEISSLHTVTMIIGPRVRRCIKFHL
jgi:hypothetical protein